MKIVVSGDIHWSQYSSILRSRGTKYSVRLEGLIQSINWVETLAREYECDAVFYLGDFFDQSSLKGEEITALNDIEWADTSHVVIVGNHEIALSTLEFSSAHLFNLLPRTTVVDKPTQYTVGTTEICFLPYVLERDRKSITDYFGKKTIKRVIFSHNDIEGVMMGKFISPEGFSITDISENCDLFMNGHIHNESTMSNGSIINVGNLTGQNFSEDSTKYKHRVYVLDTETLEYTSHINPFAFNFSKIEVEGNSGICIDTQNNVLSVKIQGDNDVDSLRKQLNANKDILEYRVVVTPVPVSSNKNVQEPLRNSFDHIERFKQFMIDSIGSSDVVLSELQRL